MKNIPVKIEENVLLNISHLHKEFPNLEWSGIIFLDTEGTLDKNNLNIRVIDLFIVDVGSHTFTSFELDETLIDLYDEKPELIGKRYGIIHTHNSMEVFFSGTDTSTLKSECGKFEWLLSLITNDKLNFQAKIATETKVKSVLYLNKFKNSEPITSEVLNSVIFDCDITITKNEYILKTIEKLKKIQSEKTISQNQYTKFTSNWDNWNGHSFKTSDFDNKPYKSLNTVSKTKKSTKQKEINFNSENKDLFKFLNDCFYLTEGHIKDLDDLEKKFENLAYDELISYDFSIFEQIYDESTKTFNRKFKFEPSHITFLKEYNSKIPGVNHFILNLYNFILSK